ncbi:MAG: methylated-DNA--[protein]-cysteine S-methyltransferase [Planctomycetota bacterium]|jgi:methylated-DNA-[protein]-cysteine S-methyltransferase
MTVCEAHPESMRTASLEADVFETPFGWFGLLGRDGQLTRISIGDANPDDALDHLLHVDRVAKSEIEVTDWYPALREKMLAYVDGEAVDFADIELVWPRPLTEFRQRVLNATRHIPCGHTATYQEIAAQAGSPGAARAVGTAMSSNRFPIVIPCHRVVGSNGGLGGFTSPQGIDLKQRLLSMEAGSAERQT